MKKATFGELNDAMRETRDKLKEGNLEPGWHEMNGGSLSLRGLFSNTGLIQVEGGADAIRAYLEFAETAKPGFIYRVEPAYEKGEVH